MWRVACKEVGVITGKERRKGGEVVLRGEGLGPGAVDAPAPKRLKIAV